jgi:CelD/BcsL family acetyltransferase involved in cellulose biosynthesis
VSITRAAADPEAAARPRGRTAPAEASLALFPSPDALPADAALLFEAAGAHSLFCGRLWYHTVLAHALPPGGEPVFAVCRAGGRVAAIFPLLLLRRERELQSLTTPYTCLWRPLLADPLPAELLRAAGAAFGRFCRSWPAVRLDALEADWPGLAPLLTGLREAGLAAKTFEQFGNWHEAVGGRSWQQYLHSRPGALRETIRRKLRRAAGETTFAILRRPEELIDGIAAYESVYRRSWKAPEPFPGFNPALMRAAATSGLLRLGLLRSGAEAIAAQLWIVANGAASLLKLAHDEAFKLLSPGTVLTALMIRELIEGEPGCEHVAELDFGRGDDGYKRLWASGRRRRIGLLLLNPRRPRGLALIGWQRLGRERRRLRGWLSQVG